MSSLAAPGISLERSPVSKGISVEVFVAATCFAVGAGLATLATVLAGPTRPVMLLAGWPVFALAGGVLLDARPGSRVGRVITVLALAPALDLLWALVRFGGFTGEELAEASGDLAPALVAAVAIAIPWALWPPRPRRAAVGFLLVAAGGALAALLAGAGGIGAKADAIGWAGVLCGGTGIWALIARSASSSDRASRRRIAWVLLTLASAGVITASAWLLVSDEVAGYVTASALIVTSLSVARLCFFTDFRPLDEHLLDLALVLGAIGTAAVVALLVRVGARWTRLPSPGTSAAFAGLITLFVATPAALWIRRTALARRYGSGALSPADVAVLTADLHARTDPRDLLDKAARIVAQASCSGQARIVLGDEAPQVPPRWVLRPLTVGNERVGALLVASDDPEGPELRQRRVIEQLQPTVALVARAVGLAVEAEHARRDVARERDAERTRILGDLHDGLGPVLAGMSMRVQAELRRSPSGDHAALLSDLGAGLAASRTDLRRIVAGIAPSTLDGGDLEGALDQLVESFSGVAGGPRIALSLDAPPGGALASTVQVAVYRCVAEGVTNALRHARASRIDVRLQYVGDRVVVDVVDDGVGGPVVPGVGLSSLEQRARSLGGCLEVLPRTPAGTRLHVKLPSAGAGWS